MAGKSRFWLRRFRSSSFSSDLDVDQEGRLVEGVDEMDPSNSRIRSNANRSKGGLKTSVYVQMTPDEMAAACTAGLELLNLDAEAFPFQALTMRIKLLVFTLLSPRDRGRVATVCRDWSVLMRSPSLWSDIDLISFPPHPVDPMSSSGGPEGELQSSTSLEKYEAYRCRAIKFMSYLVSVRPSLRRVRFAYDIADVRDGWLDILQTLFRASQCDDLEYAELNWNETPAKPYVPENSSVTWCTNDYKDLMYRHRQRQRFFVKFFDFFTASASSVTTLILPFDWTERSIRALNRLPHLDTLVLNKYFVFQSLEQGLLDTLFRSAPYLRHLTMEVWTPSGRGLQLFTMHSETLEMLDVSACRGFYLESLDLPRLRVFKVNICPMNGPLVSSEGINIACLHETLRAGTTKNLVRINDHDLAPEWKDDASEELDDIFKSVCACSRHKGE